MSTRPEPQQHARFDRARLLRLFNEGIARSDSDDDDEQTIDAILYVVLRSQPDAVR